MERCTRVPDPPHMLDQLPRDLLREILGAAGNWSVKLVCSEFRAEMRDPRVLVRAFGKAHGNTTVSSLLQRGTSVMVLSHAISELDTVLLIPSENATNQ